MIQRGPRKRRSSLRRGRQTSGPQSAPSLMASGVSRSAAVFGPAGLIRGEQRDVEVVGELLHPRPLGTVAEALDRDLVQAHVVERLYHPGLGSAWTQVTGPSGCLRALEQRGQRLLSRSLRARPGVSTRILLTVSAHPASSCRLCSSGPPRHHAGGPHQGRDRGRGLALPQQALPHEHGVHAGRREPLHVRAVPDAALGHEQPVRGHEAGQAEARLERHLERAQVAVVDADDDALHAQGPLHLARVVHLQQYVQTQVAGPEPRGRAGRGRREARR